MPHHRSDGAESQIRTGDTAIFSRVLYQLSYLGPMANQPATVRRRSGGYHEPRAEGDWLSLLSEGDWRARAGPTSRAARITP